MYEALFDSPLSLLSDGKLPLRSPLSTIYSVELIRMHGDGLVMIDFNGLALTLTEKGLRWYRNELTKKLSTSKHQLGIPETKAQVENTNSHSVPIDCLFGELAVDDRFQMVTTLGGPHKTIYRKVSDADDGSNAVVEGSSPTIHCFFPVNSKVRVAPSAS